MSNGVNNSSPAPFLTQEQKDILRKSPLCSKLSDDQADYFFEVCERTRLDPFTGQIRPDIRSKKIKDNEYEKVMLIITTLQGLRGIADRSGVFDGESEVEWTGSNGEWNNAWLPSEPPVAARASIYRKDRSRPQTEVVRWDAFCQFVYDKQGAEVPNPFWKRMGSHMLGKCSRAACYRGAFPNLCSNLYIQEELREELDKDSEEAIEAEMVRRARADKTYWDEQNKQGNFSIDQQQRREKEAQADQTDRKVQGGDLFSTPEPAPLATVPESQPSWFNFKLTRIENLKDRTVGSLTEAEVAGFSKFVENAEARWGSLDEGLKGVYHAVKARMDDDRKKVLNELDGILNAE